MAVYYLNYAPISRKAGQSAIAAAAYRATAKLTGLDGKVHNYTRKTRAVYTAMLHSADAPDWTNDRGEFWRQVETKENRINSELAKSIILALPKELTVNGQLSKNMIALVETWAKKEFVDYGLVADIAIHAPSMKGGKSNNNWHAHVLVSTRAIGKDGWSKNKDRRLSGADRRKHLDEARTDWANIVNAEFARLGRPERISEKRAVSQEELEEALAKDEKYQSLLKKKAQLEAQLRQPKPAVVQKPTPQPAPMPVKATPARAAKLTQPVAKPAPVQKPKTAEQIEFEKLLEKQTAIINNYSHEKWLTILYGDAGTPGNLKAVKASNLADAKAMCIANNTQMITAVVNPAYTTAKKELKAHLDQKPSEVAKKSNNPFIMYRDDNGTGHAKYADYKASQEKLLSDWEAKRAEKDAAAKNMTAIVNAGKRKDWHELAELIDEYLPNLAETIKAGAQKLLNTAKEFLPYRAYIMAVKARQTHEEALQRVQNQTRDTDHDLK